MFNLSFIVLKFSKYKDILNNILFYIFIFIGNLILVNLILVSIMLVSSYKFILECNDSIINAILTFNYTDMGYEYIINISFCLSFVLTIIFVTAINQTEEEFL